MKTILLLLLGATAGVVGTVMFFTIEISYDDTGREGPGGGNARLSLDQEAMANIIADQIQRLEGFDSETSVTTRIHPHGLIDVDIGVAIAPVGTTLQLVLDPEVVDGQLIMELVSAEVGGLIAPREITRLVEAQLQEQLAALAAGFEYRLTSIITTERRLTLEIEI